jgi:hypothetical protein
MALAAVAALLAACRKDSCVDPVLPPRPNAPAALIKAAGDEQSGNEGEPVAVRPAVKVVDAASQPVANVQVTFAVTGGSGTVTGATPRTGADGIAAVERWTLGAAGVNTLNATVAGLPVQTFTATAQTAVFRPTQNMTLDGGIRSWNVVDIPKGVTVTVTKDVVIRTSGDATIAGSLVGDCVSVSVVAGGKLTLAGDVNNSCAGAIPDAGAPALRLVGMGGYVVDHARAVSSGSLRITNDTSLTIEALGAAPTARANASVVKASAALDDTGIPCLFVNGVLVANPARMPDGARGTTGKPGEPGHQWSAECRGNLSVTGDLSITGQGGGNGGAGIDLTSGDADAHGGAGASGGVLRVFATRNLRFDGGSKTVLTSGRGGDGGEARATANNPGGKATAIAGAGAEPGLIELRAGGDIDINAPIELNIGQAGDGGDATALAADGRGGAVCPPQDGGKAEARGGAGGNTPRSTLVGRNVAGSERVRVTGAAAGHGGSARGVGGNGGAGGDGCIDGAPGGSQTVIGGKGGDALLKDQGGNFVAAGGRGGDATFEDGNGGHGFDGCSLTPPQKGGKGGEAGKLSGDVGAGGMGLGGLAPGGAIKYVHTGDGGDGGDGDGAGLGGDKAVRPIAGGVVTEPSFAKGKDGNPCPKLPPKGRGGDVFIVAIGTAGNAGNDTSVVRILVFPPRSEIRITEETGLTRQTTVTGLTIGGIPVELQWSGPDAFDDAGNFRARGIAKVSMGTRGLQTIVVTIVGCILPNGTITFYLIVQPSVGASFQFNPMRYNGVGARKL